MVNAINNFLSPSKSFDKFASKYENFINIGLIDRVTACIGEYSATVSSANPSSEAADVIMDVGENSLINTNMAGSNS